MEALPDFLKTFFEAADLQVVIAATIATRAVELSLFIPRGWKTYALWLPFFFAFLFTPAFANTPETAWGGPFFWRSVIYNGAVAGFFWYQILPRIRQYYDKWFGKIPSNGPNGSPSPPKPPNGTDGSPK